MVLASPRRNNHEGLHIRDPCHDQPKEIAPLLSKPYHMPHWRMDLEESYSNAVTIFLQVVSG